MAAAVGPQVEAEGLGHPLLPNDRRVGNDVVVGPPGTVLLVTGSNMSGKSTLLRSLGVNVLLGTWKRRCARRLRLGPLQLATSMRIADSLSAGVSFFMAELQRLKVIVDRSRTCRDDGRLLLFLLDEVLQGTNSRERHLAVEAVVRQLLDHARSERSRRTTSTSPDHRRSAPWLKPFTSPNRSSNRTGGSR